MIYWIHRLELQNTPNKENLNIEDQMPQPYFVKDIMIFGHMTMTKYKK